MNPLAVLCSDLHLSHNPPIARSVENWYEAMARPLDEMKNLADDLKIPIVCAGDLTDKPMQPPEFINWAIDHVPFMYCCHGQHDQINHRIDSLEKTTYGVLSKIGVIENLPTKAWTGYGSDLTLYSFPWGSELTNENIIDGQGFNLAVIHHYVWKDNRHPGARDEDCVDSIIEQLKGFDAVVSGDNHAGFLHKNLFNCGTFLRRKADEKGYKPMVGILHEDGTIIPHYLDCSQDKFLDDPIIQQAERVETDLSGFVQELRSLGVDSLDFRQAIKHRLDQLEVGKNVREIVMETLVL